MIKITDLKIDHYKTIEEPMEIKHFSNLHILIGPNNSGKTNILDALEVFFSPNLDPDRFYDSRADLSLKLLINDKDQLKIIYQANQRSYLFNNKPITGEHKTVQKIEPRLIRIGPFKEINVLIQEDLPAFKSNFPQVYKVFSQILEDYFDDVEINEDLFLENVKADRKQRPVTRMGSGFQRLFIVLFYIFHPNFDLILIDEPEMHLHPSILRRFLKILKNKDLKNQVFLTTHHPAFVQPDSLEHLWRVTRNPGSSTHIYNLANANLHFSHSRLVQELNADNSEMFLADKVILVEGVSDWIFLRTLLDRFYQGEKDIKIIYTGSKANVDVYADLFQAFDIPYLVILDRDALTGNWSELIRDRLGKARSASLKIQIDQLKSKNIFILPSNLEQLYPKKYAKQKSKPLNALEAARKITQNEFNNAKLKPVREVLDRL